MHGPINLIFCLFVMYSSSVMRLFRLTNRPNTFLYKGCYRWSWFEARSKICSAERQAKFRRKTKVKFRTSRKRISLVYNILVFCGGVDFIVTGIKFDCVYYAKGCGMLLTSVTTILPLCLPGNSTFYVPFGTHQPDSCCASLEAEKLAQAGFGDFLADTVWGGWRGIVTIIKRCILLI